MAAGDGLGLVLAVAVGAVVVAAAGTTAVELDTVALAGDAVALAGAGAAVGAGGAVAGERGAGAGAVGSVGQGRAGGHGGGTEVGDDVLLVVETGAAEAGGELLKSLVLSVEDVLGGVGRHGLGSLDLGGRQGAALGDVGGAVLGRLVLGGVLGGALGGGLAGALGGRLAGASGDIEDVQLAASGGLSDGADAGVVGNMVAVDDVVVPVSLASLEGRVLESEGTLPGAGLGGRLVLGERELTDVVVPGAEKVDGLDARRDAERERLLNSRHDELELCN